ncbi:hypothetical protein [Raoultella terrigena]|jgi:hypothetical protein|uniref:hypothetical protein n=1 Tax=Raoultella TaxID=160674 RepID=UPI00104BE1B0
MMLSHASITRVKFVNKGRQSRCGGKRRRAVNADDAVNESLRPISYPLYSREQSDFIVPGVRQNASLAYPQRALNGNIARGMVFFCSSSIEITPLFGV